MGMEKETVLIDRVSQLYISDALTDLLPFVQFKKRDKHPLVKLQASASAWNFTKSNTPPWVFITFLKLYKWYQITQHMHDSYHLYPKVLISLVVLNNQKYEKP